MNRIQISLISEYPVQNVHDLHLCPYINMIMSVNLTFVGSVCAD